MSMRDIWLFFRVLGVLTLLRVLLRRVSVRRLLQWMEPSRTPRRAELEELRKITRLTDALLRRIAFPFPGKCLPRTLVLYYFATRFGFSVTFHCGVRRGGEALEGHAWLTMEGRPFLEKAHPENTYAVTFSFPETAS